MSNKVKESYEDGFCPDCELEIPDDVVDGQECENCGHVFREELPCLRMKEDGKWACVNDHTGCLYNDGHNGCGHEGESVTPLEGV